jgi:hypothetical protein
MTEAIRGPRAIDESERRVRMRVELAITHHVSIDVDVSMKDSINQIEAEAMRIFGKAEIDIWRGQFGHVAGIDASRGPDISVERIETRRPTGVA